jgi:hypothetical protein
MKVLVFNPFEKYSEKSLLLVGILVTVIASLLAFSVNTRFDGVFDMHISNNITWSQGFIDNAINIASLSAFLFLAALIINAKTRFIDILVVAIIARIPIYLSLLINIGGKVEDLSQEVLLAVSNQDFTAISGSSIAILLLVGIVSIALLVWFVVLLFRGFKVASNAKGKLAVFMFIVAILLAEIISKLIIGIL